MTAHWPAPHAAHRWGARAGVVGLHLLLFAVLWHHRAAPLHDAAAQRITLRLLQPAPAARPRPVPPAPLMPAPTNPQPVRPNVLPPLPWADAPPTAETPAAATPPEAAAPTADAATPRTTLRLTLPPGYAASSAAARNPALSDPRSNTARRTLEDRIADAAGATGDWVAEPTSDHRTLLRRGDTCVEVLRSRIADIDRFNENVAPRAVKMVGKPYKCK